MVNRAVENVVDTVVDDVTQLAPKDVRRNIKKSVREARKNAAEGNYKPEKITPALPDSNAPENKPRSIDESDLMYRGSAPAGSRMAYPHEYHSDNMSPQESYMLTKIAQMRELEICVRGFGIVKRAIELTIVEQGDFMAQVEDDFPRAAYCALATPVYAAMSNSQLRTFFTWRTDARRGVYIRTDKPYIMLYCFELLNKIGENESIKAFDKLLEVWEGCKEFAPYLNELMPRWLKDFYAFNDVTEKYPDIKAVLGESEADINEREFTAFESGDYANKLDFLAGNSAYDIKGSAFYSDDKRDLIEAACEAALNALHDYFSKRGIELAELVCGKLKKDYTWTPFKDAIVNLDTADGFKPIRISAAERYCVKRGEPALELFDFSPSRGFIGYLLKSVEAELRIKTGYGRRLTVKLDMVKNDFANRTKLMEAISAPEFVEVIPKAVGEFCAANGIKPPQKPEKNKIDNDAYSYTRERVEIDVSKLKEIRERSDRLTELLIIDNEEDPEDDFEPSEIADQIHEEEFSELIGELKEELSSHEEDELPLRAENPFFEDLDTDWKTFANALIPLQLGALKALLDGTFKAYSRQHDRLPETIIEEINTEALAAFGDVVIENGEIIPDYLEEITKIVKASA
ncbi:MAG: TerB N-terminal domain-containing protein [Oscillospiraceae bacterium]|nr:TerB N-terminal domain-containing protein [Oscillospiraceae bacterium]